MKSILVASLMIVATGCGVAQSSSATKSMKPATSLSYQCKPLAELNPEGTALAYAKGFSLTLSGNQAKIENADETSPFQEETGSLVVPNRLKKYGDSYEQYEHFRSPYNSYTIIEKSLLKGVVTGLVKVRSEGHDEGWYEDYICSRSFESAE